MSIRPVEFSGMIQNTNEISHTKANEDNKANLQQQNIQATVVREEREASSTVQDMEEAQQHEYNYGQGGGGAGYGDSRKKKKKEKETKQQMGDGSVTVKNARPSFDMKI